MWILYKVENIIKDAEKSQIVHYNQATALDDSVVYLTPSCFSSFLLICLESSSHYGWLMSTVGQKTEMLPFSNRGLLALSINNSSCVNMEDMISGGRPGR